MRREDSLRERRTVILGRGQPEQASDPARQVEVSRFAYAGVLALLACTPIHENPAPTQETAPPTADESTCIADPYADAARIIVERHGATIAERTGVAPTLADYPAPGASCTAVSELPDLDGDGAPDLEVTEGCSWGTYGSLHVIYFSNHGCLRFADDLIAGELMARDQVHEGVHELEATWSNGCAGLDFEWTRYRWAKDGYEIADTATCTMCPDGPTDAGEGDNDHPACAEYDEDQADDG